MSDSVDLKSKTVTVCDNGLFVDIALKIAPAFKQVYYFSAWQTAFPRSNTVLVGDGFDELTRTRWLWDAIEKSDLIIFPDTFWGDLQEHLVRIGKKVWGSRKAEWLELNRAKAKEMFKSLGLPVGPYEVVRGMRELRSYLKEHPEVWIKLSLNRGDCFDSETELFTSEGWVRFPDVASDHSVLTMDMATREVSFVRPTAVIQKKYVGPMLRIKSRSLDALVTPLHRFWTKGFRSYPNWIYKTLCNLDGMKSGFTWVPQSFKWKGIHKTYHHLPNTHTDHRHKDRLSNASRDVLMSDWLSFLGWFIAEGCVTLRHRTIVSQSQTANPHKASEIQKLIIRLGFNPQNDHTGWSIYSKTLTDQLQQDCYGDEQCLTCGKKACSHIKRVPAYVKELSPDQIKIFLASYAAGDGCRDKRSGQLRYYTSSKQLADDIQELIFKAGGVASVAVHGRTGDVGGTNNKGMRIINRCESYCVGEMISKLGDTQIHSSHITHSDYDGMVYDVTVEPHHSIFVRRNGRAFWSGNCETFYSPYYEVIEPRLDQLEHQLGGKKELAEFIVEDNLESEIEVGYDGFCIDGNFPKRSFMGFELKDEFFIGAVKDYKELPDFMRESNDKLAPFFAKHQYRGFYSSELRVTKDKTAYLIDPCLRAGSPPHEIFIEIFSNWPEIFWHGAQGQVIDPEPVCKYGICAMIHSNFATKNWLPIHIPDDIRHLVKIRNWCQIDGVDFFVPQPDSELPEIGALVGLGDSLEDAIEQLKENSKRIEAYALEIKVDSLDKAMEQIEKGREMGIEI